MFYGCSLRFVKPIVVYYGGRVNIDFWVNSFTALCRCFMLQAFLRSNPLRVYTTVHPGINRSFVAAVQPRPLFFSFEGKISVLGPLSAAYFMYLLHISSASETHRNSFWCVHPSGGLPTFRFWVGRHSITLSLKRLLNWWSIWECRSIFSSFLISESK